MPPAADSPLYVFIMTDMLQASLDRFHIAGKIYTPKNYCSVNFYRFWNIIMRIGLTKISERSARPSTG